MNITRENTEIISVKVKNKEASITFSTIIGERIFNNNSDTKSEVSKGMLDALKPFTNYLATVLHYDPKDDKNFINEHIIATGIKKSGHSKKGDVVTITGKLRTASGAWIAVNSELIAVEDGAYEFTDLKDDINILCGESFKFFFENKTDTQKEIVEETKTEKKKNKKEEVKEELF